MNKIFICIPTYNEAENIILMLDTLKKIKETVADYSIGVVIIDDSSPDGTGALVEQYIKDNPKFEIHIVYNAKKAGLGFAYIKGFQYSIEHGAYAVLELDADFSHDPYKMPEMLSKLSGVDFVVGSRYIKGGKTIGWPFKRKIISLGGSIYSRLILRIGINDLTGGFNLYKTKIFEKVNLSSIKSNGFSFQIELKYKVAKAGFKGVEVPIVFKDRVKGKSKFSGSIFKEAIWVPWKLVLGKM